MSVSISIKAENIEKRYGNKTAINDISFEVNSGELFGFIGPDGAGKTTLFHFCNEADATAFILKWGGKA